MHELSLAQDILQVVLDQIEKAQGKRISRVVATVRESIHHTEEGSIEVCLNDLAKGTVAEGVGLSVELIPPTLKCRDCRTSFSASEGTLICPSCHSSKLEELDADEVDIECHFAE